MTQTEWKKVAVIDDEKKAQNEYTWLEQHSFLNEYLLVSKSDILDDDIPV